MNDFIGHIISRHIAPAENVKPRLPGKFEQDNAVSTAVTEKPTVAITPLTGFQDITAQSSAEVNDTGHIPTAATGMLQNIPGTFSRSADENSFIPAARQSPSAIFSFKKPDPVFHEKPGQDADDAIPQKDHLIIQQRNTYQFVNESHDIHEKENNVEKVEKIKIRGEGTGISFREKQNEVKPVINEELIKPARPVLQGLLGDPPGAVTPGGLNAAAVNFSVQETAPVIKVSIGQINIRATVQSQVTQKRTVTQARKPALSLDDYLKKRG